MLVDDIEPENGQELQGILAHSRPSLSPSRFSDGTFNRFRKAEAEARDEHDVIKEALPTFVDHRRCD